MPKNKKKNTTQSKTSTTNTGPTHLLIIAGLPGSGKSTLSSRFTSNGWIRVSQDDLGSQQEVKRVMEKAFKNGNSVILDRCNVHRKERKGWVTYAKTLGCHHAICVYLDPGVEVCKERVLMRVNHPTLGPENGEEVIDQFCRGMTPPELWEGPYDKVFHVTDPDLLEGCYEELRGISVSTKVLRDRAL